MDEAMPILLALIEARKDYCNTPTQPNMEIMKQFDTQIKAQLTKVNMLNINPRKA